MPDSIHSIDIPLLNPNEPEALLAQLYVQEGQEVQAGDPLCTLETTKSSADLEAPAGGYVVGLHWQAGQSVQAGQRLCYLAPDPDWKPAEEDVTAASDTPAPEDQAPPPGLRITQPALALAHQTGLDLNQLPFGPLVTESQVRALLDAGSPSGQAVRQDFAVPAGAFDPAAILVYGGGGHGKMLIDLLRAQGQYRIVGVIDDGLPPGSDVMGAPVLGGGDRLQDLYDQGLRLAVNAVGGIGRVDVRVRVFERLAQAGFVFPPLVHPGAIVEPSAELAPGAQVLARAYVGSQAYLDFGAIVNTGAIVSHDCHLGAYAIVSPGAILAGEVTLGEGALVGMGATVNLQVQIGAGARVGNSATVKQDVPSKGIVRAGTIWPS